MKKFVMDKRNMKNEKTNSRTNNRIVSRTNNIIIRCRFHFFIKKSFVIASLLMLSVLGLSGCSEKTVEKEQKIAYLYMPSLVGMMEEEATGKLSDMGFYNCIVEYEMSELTEPGRVIRQSIPEHTTVGTDYEIKIWISQGK